MSTNEITAKVRELKELKIMADELAAEISTLEDEVVFQKPNRGAGTGKSLPVPGAT